MKASRYIGVTVTTLIAVALIASAGCSRGSTPAVGPADAPLYSTLTLSTNSIHVGDLIVAELTAYHPTGTQVRVPGLGTGKEIVVRNRDWSTEEARDGRLRTTARYELTSFRVGTHTVSEEQITCEGPGGETLRTAFPFTNITVLTVLSDTNAVPADIKDLASYPRMVPRWLWALLAIVILAVALALLARRYLGTPRTIIQKAPPPPPHEVALHALERLRREGLIEQGRIEPFYVRLSAIVRHYIEDRFGLRAPEQTTEEFIREASRSHDLSADHRKLTQNFLEQSDLVKFARHTPAQSDMQAALESGERLVRETIPAEVSEDQAGGEG